jgi:hypothetical protein
MAKLSEDFLDEGRALIRAKDLDGFMEWVSRSKVIIDHDVVRSMYHKCFLMNDTEKTLKIFEAVFPGQNPQLDLAVGLTKLGCLALFVLGAIGGVAFLVHVIFF